MFQPFKIHRRQIVHSNCSPLRSIDANWRAMVQVDARCFPSMLSVLVFAGCSATIYKSTKHLISVTAN